MESMAIMGDKHGFIEELVKLVKSVEKKYYAKRFVVEALTGVLIVKNN